MPELKFIDLQWVIVLRPFQVIPSVNFLDTDGEVTIGCDSNGGDFQAADCQSWRVLIRYQFNSYQHRLDGR